MFVTRAGYEQTSWLAYFLVAECGVASGAKSGPAASRMAGRKRASSSGTRVDVRTLMASSTRTPRPARKSDTKRWSARVTRTSNALDLDRDVFTWKDPRKIARSLKRSAERSHRRKSEPYRSAMSMLTFYINRAGDNLGARQRHVLEQAKVELRHAFGRD